MNQQSPERTTASLVDWLFRDRETDRIIVAQFPNPALWAFIVSVVLRWVVPAGTVAHRVLEGIKIVALAWWALDELFRGVNPWRRLLGLAGCLMVVGMAARLR
jgi:hypothetical protein